MNKYTTNQPIGSTVSDHDITHRLHNGKCLDCPEHDGDNPDVCTGCSEHNPLFSTGANPPPYQGNEWQLAGNNPVSPREVIGKCDYCKEDLAKDLLHFCRKRVEDTRDKAVIHELKKQMAENCGAHTLTPLGEALQANCPRCNMRWIIHNCPEYPKLISSNEMIKKLARGAVLQELAENADYFCSVKCDGEEFNVYIRENNLIK